MPHQTLIVAAHPHDELLGCGGTIACHAEAGDLVQVLIVEEGVTLREEERNLGQAAEELCSLLKLSSQTVPSWYVRGRSCWISPITDWIRSIGSI